MSVSCRQIVYYLFFSRSGERETERERDERNLCVYVCMYPMYAMCDVCMYVRTCACMNEWFFLLACNKYIDGCVDACACATEKGEEGARMSEKGGKETKKYEVNNCDFLRTKGGACYILCMTLIQLSFLVFRT